MDAFASPSTRADTLGWGVKRCVETVLLTLALGLSLVGIPGTPDTRLDASWQIMLIHAHQAHLQFGRDVIFTWGPWGFLCCGYHMGATAAVPILLWQTVGQFLVALALVLLTRGLELWRRLAFAVLFLAFHWLFLDVVYFLLISLVALSGLMRRGSRLLHAVGWAIVLGCLAQLKFTYFVLSAAGILAAMVCWAGRGSWRRAAAIPVAYAAAVLGAWVAAGQNPDNLYPYVRRSLEIASGYGGAMGLDESWTIFLWGAAVALACLLALCSAWRALPERPYARGACAYLAFSLFLMWKEGFTRADFIPLGGHVLGFFAYVVILAPAASGLLYPGRRLHWLDLTAPLCLAAFAGFDGEFYSTAPRIFWQRIYGNATSLGRVEDLPRDWEQSYQNASRAALLPRIDAAVGRSTVDVYDFNTAAALMNGLTLDARPIFQGYSAYTPGLAGWNLRHYQSAAAPDYLMWSAERIDNRYPAQDDAMLVEALPGHYAPVLQEGDFGLFRRVSIPGAQLPAHRLLLRRRVRLSEEIDLSRAPDCALWLEADAAPDTLGRLRALLYKPAELYLTTRDERGRLGTWRLVPQVARAGFLLVPTLTSVADAAALLRGETHSRVQSFHFEAPASQEEFWTHVDVSVFAIPDIPLRMTTDG